MAGSAQIRSGSRQCPTSALDTQLRADVLESSVAEIVKEIAPPAVGRVLEAVGHDARGLQVPQVDVLGKVSADEEIQETVAVIVEPHRGVAVDPGGQPGLLGHAGKAVPLIVVIQL